MNLVADESVDSGITEGLRKKGINVFSNKLKGNFSVLTKNGLRIKIINKKTS